MEKTSSYPDICVKLCRQHACNYQICLNKQGVDKPERCTEYLVKWKECCEKVVAVKSEEDKIK
jgi:hypothetical protein